jgi:hypothetical protein
VRREQADASQQAGTEQPNLVSKRGADDDVVGKWAPNSTRVNATPDTCRERFGRVD